MICCDDTIREEAGFFRVEPLSHQSKLVGKAIFEFTLRY